MKTFKELEEANKDSMVKDFVAMVKPIIGQVPKAMLSQSVANARKQIESQRPDLLDTFDKAMTKLKIN